ncbi:hypothetical protein CSV79_15475 [Sporosarcina sp. P13]|uniref:hypothetical protein n=1 Tax=Sporosarcina sp. P13 TaxID=2048263 RepID=UPI000C1665AF|nr:hypothetical protein [Sporosarcina sp. P13]PIC62746.1 hypothetical protein CSV79_15475 [Sporosarcina sp. P13]
MTAYNRFTLTMICFSVLIAGTLLIKQTASSEQAKIEFVGIDYAEMNKAVELVLLDMPEIAEELKEIRSGVHPRTIDRSFSNKKTKFRIRIKNNLTQKEHSSAFLRGIAEKQTSRYKVALEIAESEYGIRVTEEEVDTYIKQNVATVWNMDKRKYAKALDLTLNELDYAFDRDVYAIDALWQKIQPIVMEEIPRQRGEGAEAYRVRIKEEYFSREVESEK